MNSESSYKFALPPVWLRFLIIILLILGIFFRLVNLDRKVYWLDESHTSLRIFGYTEPEFIKDVFANQVVTSTDLVKYQSPSPEKGWSDTVRVVGGNTEHAPLYYLSLRVWAQVFGSSVAGIRSFSAAISFLAFPAIYWLCLELFQSSLAGWISIALLTISPFHILYAQEARPYSLLTVAILFSSAALLRGIRVKTKASWILYGIALTLGLYTHWFFAVVAVSHALYVAVIEKCRPNKTVIAYVLASIAGLIAFSPWIINAMTAPPPLKEQMGWVFQKLPLFTLVKSWELSVSRAFFDLDRGWCLPPGNTNCRYLLSYDEAPIYFLIIPIILLVGYSIYFLYRQTSPRVWLFITILIGVMALALIVPDLIKGGQRSTVTRYLIPCLLGIQLTVAYCLAAKISYISVKLWQQKLWQIAMVVLISLGVLSSAVSSQADGWWSKGGNYHVAPIAEILNQANKPLVFYSVPSDVLWGKGGSVGRVMPLIRMFAPKVGILFVVQPKVPEKIPDGFDELFVYRPHEELKQWLEQDQNYKLEAVALQQKGETPRIWKLIP